MRILVIADRVCPALYENFNKRNFPGVDLVISCGDLPRYYLEFLVDALNVPCFYVPGNHDNDLYHKGPAGWVNLDQQLVDFQGLKIVGIGGSPFYNGESPFQYTENQIFWQCLKLKLKLWRLKAIDILVTHSPAFGMGDIPQSRVHQGFKPFNRFIDRFKPQLFLYGHTHLDYGVKRIGVYDNTLLINGFRYYKIDWPELDLIKKKFAHQNTYRPLLD